VEQLITSPCELLAEAEPHGPLQVVEDLLPKWALHVELMVKWPGSGKHIPGSGIKLQNERIGSRMPEEGNLLVRALTERELGWWWRCFIMLSKAKQMTLVRT